MEGGFQTVVLVERPPLITAAVKLVLDHHGERRRLGLRLVLLLRRSSTGAEAQLGGGRVRRLATALVAGIARARLIGGVYRGGSSGAGVRLSLDARLRESAAAALQGRRRRVSFPTVAALLHFGKWHRGYTHDLGDHIEQRLGAARRSLRCLHIKTARVGER